MLFLILLLGAAVVAVLLVRTLRSEQVVSDRLPRPDFPWSAGQKSERPRTTGPDDDPDFLRQLDEKVRNEEDPPDRA
ncbi:hypothetical protein Ae168Ps1_2662 [Pseudonocardia sp. Ae168_Ps1]|jgi:hypothetical protein|uniref:hypothetical protein n=1 Tax=unclassified Pseudonocardia TaxID=2619320 RepID=UPI0001FFE84A|nr:MULTISPECIES: hypothetical protein [unclassified Pseudonocardia]ALE72087.1 hypothetical protein FRP1_01130 [Pseudonocardia sp. EC080625-04]ALL75370.1 hypothetical protein AD006_08760 [Pseudonocardia sp. EC080610-09]ALL82395.1 hypothetical protein AD017_16590 [Pseudonocardia sp. EC080619-01]OLL74275.1 hypothetical protein Ae150APs1_2653 [Pseudonocardia sp. Ae150A_Ps1]OLL80256.1 hypothetical protein Ae168Ps1_2662 [Pseudonocardia sp. Ae168_Ps1]